MDGHTPDDMMALPLDRFLNRVVAWLRDRMKPSEWQSYEFRLHLPPPGEEVTAGPWATDNLGDTWRSG